MIRIKDASKTLQGITLVMGNGITLSEDSEGFPRLDVSWSATSILVINADVTGGPRELRFLDKPSETQYNWAIIAQRSGGVNDAMEFVPSTAVGGSIFSFPTVVMKLSSTTKATTSGSLWHLTVRHSATAAAGVGGGITFQGFITGTTAYGTFGAIDAVKENATVGNEAGVLRLWYSDAGTLTEGLRITSAGRVGIGTTGPHTGARVHVVGRNMHHEYSTTSGQGYGFWTSKDNNHFMENTYYDGSFKTIKTGKGAIIQTAAEALDMALIVKSDNTSRSADAVRTFVNIVSIDTLGNTDIVPHSGGDPADEGRFKAHRFVLPVGADKWATI